MALPIARGTVVECAVARNVGHGVGSGDLVARLADHDGEFAFIIETLGHGRLHHRLAVSNQTVGIAHEDGGMGLLLATGFLDMLGIVEADAQYLRRIGNDRQRHDIGNGEGRAIGQRRKAAIGQCGLQARHGLACQFDDGFAVDAAEAGGAVGTAEADITH